MQLPKYFVSGANVIVAGFGVICCEPAAAVGNRGALEEVVVSARKQDEVSQDVPLSIATLDADAMVRRGVADIADIARQVPSLSVVPYPQSASTAIIYLRGVGTGDSEQIARDVGVGIYLDDVYMGRAQGLATQMVDLERIEVLRGPQGTLYGRNTIGGAVKFVTAKPRGEWGFKQSLDVGNRGRWQAVTALDLPTLHEVSAKLTYFSAENAGLVGNPGVGGDFGERDARGYRIALRWMPDEAWTVDYSYDHSRQDGTPHYSQRHSGPPAPYGYAVPLFPHRLGSAYRAVDLPLQDDFQQRGHALTLAWSATDAITLKSVTAHRSIDSQRLNDTVESYGIPAVTQGWVKATQFTQEFILSGAMAHPDITYIFGVFYYHQIADQFANDGLANPFALVVDPTSPFNAYRAPTLADLGVGTLAYLDNRSRAVYGNATWTPDIWDGNFSVTLGARYSTDERAINRFSGNVFLDRGDTAYHSFDPALTLDYRWSSSIHTYYRVARAFRSGGYSIRTSAQEPYDQETLVAHEVGAKSKLWDDRVRFNIDVFRSSYSDIQLDFINFSDFSTHTINAADATIDGVEVEFAIVPLNGLQLRMDYTYLDSELDTVIDPFTRLPWRNSILAHVPRSKYNLDVEYTLPPTSLGMISARLGYSWNDPQASGVGDGSSLDRRPGYGVWDARITVADIAIGDSKLSASLWGKNLRNTNYVIYRYSMGDVYGELRSYGMNVILTY